MQIQIFPWRMYLIYVYGLGILCFSPEDLLAHKKKPSQLPLHGGPKAFAPDDTNEEDDTLTSLLQEQKDVLQEQRVSKKYLINYSNFNCQLHLSKISH